jgi:ATPase subunit of ABC transporter with duplicated ATPase domains
MYLGKNYYPKTEFLIERVKIISHDQSFLQYISQLISEVSSQSNHIYEMSYNNRGEYYSMREEFYDFFCTFMEKQILEDKLAINPDIKQNKIKI